MLRLVVHYGSHVRRYPLPAGEVRVGSAADNGLVLPYPGVSRHHAVLRPQGRSLLVQDLESKNGVEWQGRRVAEARLSTGESVRLGNALVQLEEVSTSDAELGLTLDRPSSSQPSTLRLAEGQAGDDVSSPGEALRVVKELESSSRWDFASDQESAAMARRALGASSLSVLQASAGGDLAFLACDGDLPEGRQLDEMAKETSRVGRAPLLLAEKIVEGSTCLLAGSGPPEPRFLAALFQSAVPMTPWRRDFFDHLARKVLSVEDPSSEPALREASALRFPADVVIGESPVFRNVLEELEATVGSHLDILLLGETGTGKEIFARMIHASGPSSEGPFVAINCAAIPSELLEAELFGVAARVATGVDPRPGHFLEADGGTLFLDEIGELSASLQPKLLRVLQEREVLPLGASKAKPFRVRIVAASNRDVEAQIERGAFRTDLYYRLAQLSFRLPALRERPEDVPKLVFHFVGRSARQYGKRVRGVSRKALERLLAYSWPGNVRELESVVTKSVLLCPDGGTVESKHLTFSLTSQKDAEKAPEPALLQERVDALERDAILEALRETHGNKTQAAKRLGLTRNGLDSKLKRLGLSASDWG